MEIGKYFMCPQMYFNSTLTDSSKLLKPLLVFSFIICAIICGLTRIIQYKNHAIDVYLGFLLGGAIAVYLVGTSPVNSLHSSGFTVQKDCLEIVSVSVYCESMKTLNPW